MRALIVNGDDFGLTQGVNAGILDAHLHGILTSTSLFANRPATDDAITIARQTPTLGVGCHLTLVDGVPVLPSAELPTLAPGGAFRATWGRFLAASLAGRIELQEIERELSAQIERLRDSGITLTHLDSHKHVHAYPPVFEIVARLAARLTIPVVRVPYERPALALVARFAGTRGPRKQALENLALAAWAERDRRLLTRHGLPPAPRFLGRVLTGFFTRHRFHALLNAVPDGVNELMTHPGYVDTALKRMPTRLRTERTDEVRLLMASEIRETIRRAGIVLVRHDGQLQRESHVA